MTQKTMISLLIPAEQGISARDTFDTDCVARHFRTKLRTDQGVFPRPSRDRHGWSSLNLSLWATLLPLWSSAV